MWIVATCAALALTIAAVVAVRWWTWRPIVSKRAMVQSGEVTFEGIVVSRRGPLLILTDVTVRSADNAQPAAGNVVIERRHVDWMQVL